MQPLKKKVGEIVRTSALETKIYPGHEKRGVNDLKSPRYFATLKLYHKYVQTALSLKSQFFSRKNSGISKRRAGFALVEKSNDPPQSESKLSFPKNTVCIAELPQLTYFMNMC